MTVSTSVYKAGPYAGSGTTGPFTVNFRFLANSHLRVIKTSTTGSEATLTLGVDYSVTGAGGASGTVTLTSPLLTGEKLTIVRNVPLTQETDYVVDDSFPAESHEQALDKLTMIAQQLAEEVDRAVKVLPSSTDDPDALIASVKTSEQNAAASAASAAASYDEFDDRYLGAKTSNPTVDNDGNALQVGAEYWNSVSNERRTWTGSEWVSSITVVPDGSVTTAKLADGVLSADVAGRAKMADNFVTLAKLDSTARQLDTTRIDVASAAIVNLTNSAPNTRHINITGTTQITAFTVAIGVTYFVRFNASLTLINNANIVTQTGSNITTQAGDTCILRATAANVVEALSYVPAKNASQQGTAPIFGARAWVNFDGTGTVAIRASGNVSSITDQGTGNYTVNFTTAMPDTNYSICYGFDTDADNVNQFSVSASPRTMYSQQSLKTTSNFRIFCGSNASVGSAALDFRGIDISVFR